ncbi:hypothetical protein NLM33_46275 [Bradyrhizobium sp. CCGUVB1N3]|uniref:hypothetical protein n=1 Tax=Bradyrhizobium sp. CCGUVB1N3 TaxID=2949629 RepID=UPI0020B28B6B|nr:hypothetical protein [Bradyrhizobium sp. CCGUVB1N3]MCP3477571.1 hypothetical protein [Bradyrhizobium sp. CCGUVB1N3]
MTQTIRSDMIRKLIAVAVVLGSTSAQAQNCVQYPPGPFRRQCVEANHPQVGAKIERCKEEALSMGLNRSMLDPAMKDYVQACMHRR